MQYCVVVANGNQAKFFTLEEAAQPEYQSSPNLVETQSINHPDYHPSWSEERMDDIEIDKHNNVEHDRRFASDIAQAASQFTRRHHISDVVVVSQSRMLGHLRQALQQKLRGVSTQELVKDLSKLNPHELHSVLAKEKLIPKRKRPQH